MITSIRELRTATKQVISAVNRGDTVLITNRGKPCAKIIPVFAKRKQKKEEPLFGIWRDNKVVHSVKRYMNDLRKRRHAR